MGVGDGQRQGVVGNARFGLSAQLGACLDGVNQLAGNGNFGLGLFRQRHADGIADALGEQGSDAHGALDAPVFALAGLGNAQMERIVHVFAVHGFHQKAHRLHHHHRVGCLDADHHIVELLAAADAQKLHATLHYALGGVAVAAHDAVGEAAVVHTDAHGCMVSLADVEEWHKLALYLLQFFGIFLVGILQMLERATGVYIVAGIHSHLLTAAGCHVGHLGIEVHIGHKGCEIASLAQTVANVFHVLGLARSLSGEPHILAASLDNADGLLDTCLGIHRVSGGHRLDADGVVAAHGCAAHMCHGGEPPLIVRRIAHFVSWF